MAEVAQKLLEDGPPRLLVGRQDLLVFFHNLANECAKSTSFVPSKSSFCGSLGGKKM